MNEYNYDGRWIYGKLRHCSDMKVVSKLYRDWVKTNNTLVGFLCEARDLFGRAANKPEKMEKVQAFIDAHQLPLEILDLPYHVSRFKLKILKYGLEVPKS